MFAAGIGIGVGASFTGLGGGFLIVPLLLGLGFAGSQAAGTSMAAVAVIAASAVVAHYRLGQVDLRTGLLLGIGGLIGAQLGAHLVGQVSTELYRKIFAGVLAGLSLYLFLKK